MDSRRKRVRGCPFDFSKEALLGYIEQGLSSPQIAKILNVTDVTIRTYSRKFQLTEKLTVNGRRRQASSLYKDGRASYRKFKKSHCELCGLMDVRLEVHHKTPVKYDENWSIIIEGDHRQENLLTVCNSCHQKTHYRELGRSRMRSNGRRFFSNN